MRKSFRLIICLSFVIYSCTQITAYNVSNMKDLGENMMDIRVYHENLGMYIKLKDADYALWLANDLDSVLNIVSNKFKEHRKLTAAFEKTYIKELKPYLAKIISTLNKNDFNLAKDNYIKLTKNCNGCHIDNDIDKEVFDWSK